MTCAWCSKEFPPKDGKRFCSPSCRSAYHSAAKLYADAMIDSGLITVANLRAVAGVDGTKETRGEV